MKIKKKSKEHSLHFLEGPFSTGAEGSFLGTSTFGGSNGMPPFATLNLKNKHVCKSLLVD
jgi:hypothetical protein